MGFGGLKITPAFKSSLGKVPSPPEHCQVSLTEGSSLNQKLINDLWWAAWTSQVYVTFDSFEDLS